ncbi:MAG: efflux RND transporter periplasmic adaptor subunit [Candidatus Omnitrophota bacterium]
MKNQKYLLFVICYALFAVMGCAKETQEKRRVEAPLVRVITPITGEIASRISLTGTIVPWQDTYIAPKIQGRVEKILVEEGQKVKKDQPLILVEKIDYELSVQKSQAALMSANANLENAVANFSRMKKLLERDTISKQEYDRFEAAYKSAQAQAKDAQASLSISEDKLANTSINAPFEGFIAEKLTEVGEQVSSAEPVIRIANINKVKVEADVPQNFLGQIKEGKSVKVKVDTYPGEVFSGKIFSIRPIADLATRTFNVKIELDNPKYLLRGGMFANVDIMLERRQKALILPRDAVLFKEGKAYVFVVEDLAARRRDLELGISEENNVEILSGISKEDIIVVSGQGGLDEGMRVRIGE